MSPTRGVSPVLPGTRAGFHRRSRRALAILAAVGLATAALSSPTAWGAPAGAVPEPENDPFYAVPRTVGEYRPGAVIDARAVEAKSFEIPVPAKAWQVKYRTEDSRRRPTATVTTVLVPLVPWRGESPRPLLSYQTAEDGVAGRCAPSYALRAGIRGGFTGSYSETSLISSALERGWVVSVPDYEGPRSEFLVAGTQAKGVLDGIRAARSFRPAGVSAAAPIGLWGYSGGSLASVTAAQLQPKYAPDLQLTALALGGLLGDVRATIDAFSGSIGGGAIPMGINGFLRAYPELKLGRYLTEDGRAKVRATARDCIFDAARRYPFLRIADIEATPDALSAPPVARMLRQNSPLHIAGIPDVPIYHYHTVNDQFAPIAAARATLHRFCARGAVVHSEEKQLGEHLSEIALGAPGALRFLGGRFAGAEPVNTCDRVPPR